MKRVLIGFLLFCSMTLIHAIPSSFIWYTHSSDGQVTLNLDLFLSSTCTHCQKAEGFFRSLEQKTPWLKVNRYVINEDKAALQLFYEHLENDPPINFSVPAMFFCGSRWSGFNDDQSTGSALLRALTYCYQKIVEQGELSLTTLETMHQWGAASQLHMETKNAQSLPFVLVSMALTDAMNPCSFFCFGAFLAFLWICAPRKFLQFVVGVVFITVLGVLHFTQQTQSSLYSQLIPPLKMAAPWVGLLLILSIVSMYRKRLPKMHLTETPWIFIVLILTVLVEYIYQQPIRGFNLSLVFEQWLIEQTMPPVNRLVCEVGYQLVYLLPISIILLVYLLIQHRPWVSRYQDNFKTAGCFILMSIAILLVGHPQWLAHFFISSVVILVAIGLAFIVKSVRIS